MVNFLLQCFFFVSLASSTMVFIQTSPKIVCARFTSNFILLLIYDIYVCLLYNPFNTILDNVILNHYLILCNISYLKFILYDFRKKKRNNDNNLDFFIVPERNTLLTCLKKRKLPCLIRGYIYCSSLTNTEIASSSTLLLAFLKKGCFYRTNVKLARY